MHRALAFIASVALSSVALAQAPIVYPAKGQSPEQVDRDKGECHVWAVKETGFDPASRTAPPQTIAVAQQTQPATGGRVRGAARGAAAGAVVGEVAGNDAGEGAAAGAAVGAMAGGSRQRRQNRSAPATTEQPNPEYEQYLQERGRYDAAVKACLTGRGYTVS